jgi:transcriptional regulator with XRE-family HTH domain
MKRIEYYQFSGEEFKHLRKKMRFSQTERSRMLGISLPMINLIEKDKRVMNPDVAIAFVDIVKKFLGYDISLSLDAFLRVQLRELKR